MSTGDFVWFNFLFSLVFLNLLIIHIRLWKKD